MSPVVPDWEKFPETGRNLKETFGIMGLSGHWVKRMLHTLFIYKAKARNMPEQTIEHAVDSMLSGAPKVLRTLVRREPKRSGRP
jgi:hypothetical protein